MSIQCAVVLGEVGVRGRCPVSRNPTKGKAIQVTLKLVAGLSQALGDVATEKHRGFGLQHSLAPIP